MKHINRIRPFALLCLFALLLLTAALPAAAVEPTWTPSAAYRGSTYYQNLKTIPVTGDKAFDTLSVALSQIGYHEANGTAGLDGSTGGNGNYTEYNRVLGKIGGSYSYAWCASFVSFCLLQAGASESAQGMFASCTLWVDALRETGQYRTRSSGYTPSAGDLIFFRSSGTARASDHVGLVRYVKGGRVYTVEGNSSDRVALRQYALTDSYIVGYGLPAYGEKRVQIDRLKAEDAATGVYAVTYDFLNVRATASAAGQKRGTLPEGAVISVLSVSDGWGKIMYEGNIAYISLDYADFVAPFRYNIRYISEGKELYVSSYYSTDVPSVATITPEREEYEFLHWEDGNKNTYMARDTLPVGDVTLNAVFRPLPVFTPPDSNEEDIPSDGTQIGTPDSDNTHSPDSLPESNPPGTGSVPHPPRTAAARHAGVVSGLVSVVLGGAWLLLHKKREET